MHSPLFRWLALVSFSFLVPNLRTCFAAPPATLTAAEKSAGWRLLFDGHSLAGWRLFSKPAATPIGPGWKVEDGILKKVAGIKTGDIITAQTFDNFELSWEWRIEKDGNNGVKYFVTEARPAAPGHEYQMIDDNGHPDGLRGGSHTTASIYDIKEPVKDKGA